jgi:TolB protein
MIKVILPILLTLLLSCNNTKSVGSAVKNSNDMAIAYNIAVKDSAGKSNYEVFTMNIDGSNARNITNNKDVAWTYQANGKDLYFVSDRDTCYRCYFLYRTDVNGTKTRKVSDLQLEDSFMDSRKDGREIIVSGRKGKDVRFQLFIIDTESGSFRQLTNDTAAHHRDPAFSPDGRRIAFIYRKNKRDRSLVDEVFIMNDDLSGLRQLTVYPKDSLSKNINGYKAGATRWHPTENFISYISMQEGRHKIYAVTPDGKKQWKLINSFNSDGWHDWSPDGQWLAFDMANEEESQYHIMLMNWKTKEVKQLTDTTHKYQQSPVFVLK